MVFPPHAATLLHEFVRYARSATNQSRALPGSALDIRQSPPAVAKTVRGFFTPAAVQIRYLGHFSSTSVLSRARSTSLFGVFCRAIRSFAGPAHQFRESAGPASRVNTRTLIPGGYTIDVRVRDVRVRCSRAGPGAS